MQDVDDEPAPDLLPAIAPRLARRSRRPSMMLVASVAIALAATGLALGVGWAHVPGVGGPAVVTSASEAVAPSSTPGDSFPPSPAQTPDASPPPGTPRGSTLAVATNVPGAGGSDALAIGRLGGERRDGTACTWLVQGSLRTALVWPFGFSALDDPLRLIGPDGQVLAVVGDDLELGGGGPPVGFVPTDSQDPCAVGRLFAVSTVSTVNGQRVDVGEGSLRLVTRPPGPEMACPASFLQPVMLVMTDGRLRLRTGGQDVDVSWPAGFSALPGNRIRIVDARGGAVMTQGVPVDDARGITAEGKIDICGLGTTAYE